MYAGVAIRILWCSAALAAMVIQHCKCSVIPNPSAQLQNLQQNTAAENGEYHFGALLLTALLVATQFLRGNSGVYRIGVQYFISGGELYALEITTKNTSLTRLTPINRDSVTTESSTNPFLVPETGSGLNIAPDLLQELSSTPQQYVYTVDGHHAYIAVGQAVIVLLLNTETPNYHRIEIGQTPLKLEARDLGGEKYLFVLYETNSRGYVSAYRKYSNGNWGKQGQYNLLVYSPQWFDLSQMSNILFVSADDYHYSYKVTYVALAVGNIVYFKELLDFFEFTIPTPEPCSQIVSIEFNEVKQTLFIVCTNITFYFSYLDYQLYTSSLWNRTGHVSFAHDGRVAAIATNHSGGMTTVTIHGLNFEPSGDEDERVYEFQHFHHVASRSLIIHGEFVTASKNLHYYCYIEQMESGIVCINVELALVNVRNEGIINDATLVLPNTHAVLCPSTKECPVMYSHDEMLVVEVRVCEQGTGCVGLAMIFNMSSLENIANLTHVSLDMLAYKADTQPIIISPSTNTTTPVRSSAATPKATKTFNSAVSTSTSVIQTPVSVASESTPTTTVSSTDNMDMAKLLDTCQSDLALIDTAYSRLLTVTIALCVCFSTAMVVTILILVALICCNKRGTTKTKDCT